MGGARLSGLTKRTLLHMVRCCACLSSCAVVVFCVGVLCVSPFTSVSALIFSLVVLAGVVWLHVR